ncbi:MAG: NUDIX domain-containing protein [Sphingomonas bacterium]|nr:NUDIX domain-containing protein [Sphingomonas bacterium]
MTNPAIPAATLIVMRDRDGAPPELLMVERSAAMAFAGGAMVFPGGRVDSADESAAEAHDQPDAAARIAAIRETIEESSVAAGLSPIPDPAIIARLAQALHSGMQFTDLLTQQGLTLDLAALTPFARWKPAFHQARIFDTLFFVVRAPPGDWHPTPQPGECEAVLWISAADLLNRIAAGQATAIFPTIRNLERLAQHASVAAAQADAAAHPITTITPWIEESDGIQYLRIPEGLGYPVTREPLDTVRRGVGAASFPAA